MNLARSQSGLAKPEVLPIARAAVDRVLRKSELQELWSDGGPGNPWREEMLKLSAKLSQMP
jgi:hypothetical protein